MASHWVGSLVYFQVASIHLLAYLEFPYSRLAASIIAAKACFGGYLARAYSPMTYWVVGYPYYSHLLVHFLR